LRRDAIHVSGESFLQNIHAKQPWYA
jgi:hypothetical protein